MGVHLALQKTQARGAEPPLHLRPVDLLPVQSLRQFLVLLQRVDVFLRRVFHLVEGCDQLPKLVLVRDVQVLPAEIAARQKQYEYYRNKLLTFKQVEVNQ